MNRNEFMDRHNERMEELYSILNRIDMTPLEEIESVPVEFDDSTDDLEERQAKMSQELDELLASIGR